MLSIMILTRNRKDKIIKTLLSCMECAFPEQVEFVIVDNASEDGTQPVVEDFLQQYTHEYQYIYLRNNTGVAAGRNAGYNRAKGRYVYFIDDDAFIDGPKNCFFERMINTLATYPDVFCVTTAIYDTAFNTTRSVVVSKRLHTDKYRKAMMFHGGSFLVDKQRVPGQQELFLAHQFRGMQELYPSLSGYFHNRYIVYLQDLNIIHDPGRDIRFYSAESIMRHYVHATEIKLRLYPSLVHPLVWSLFCLRIIKHLGPKSLTIAVKHLSHLDQASSKETSSLHLFHRLVHEFGLVSSL